MRNRPKIKEEFFLCAVRYCHFFNIWIVYHDLLREKYVPSEKLAEPGEIASVDVSIMFILHSYFYSLIEDDDEAMNAFRIWRELFPEEEAAISSVELMVKPFKPQLKRFRNRVGFHGSRSVAHEAKGYEIFSKHKADQIYTAIKQFKSLGAAMLGKAHAQASFGGDTPKIREWLDAIGRVSITATLNP